MPTDLLEPTDLPEPTDVRQHSASGIDAAVDHLMIEFEGLLSADRVRDVVAAGRQDLASEVPPEALPEFLHRLARQRLADLRTSPDDRDSHIDGSRAVPLA